MLQRAFEVCLGVSLLISLPSALSLNTASPPLVVVNTSQGELLGNAKLSRNGRTYHEFLGIPYGKVEKRFGVNFFNKLD